MGHLDYYQTASKASKVIKGHPGLEYLQTQTCSSSKILDLGCGEGTRLNTLIGKSKAGWGIDINKQAVKQARTQYPHHKFFLYDGKKLPFKDSSFNLVYSAFVLEHTTNPSLFIKQAVRVLKPNGLLILLCPNFGAPNRRSPNSIQRPILKLITGFIKDFFYQDVSSWVKVHPKKTYSQIDNDTTIEPYLLSLTRYLKKLNYKIIKASSLWELEEKTLNPRKFTIALLGKLNIFPFKYWGPQIFIAIQK